MPQETFRSIADGALQVGAERGRLVLKGPGFYISLNQQQQSAFAEAIMQSTIDAALQVLEAKAQALISVQQENRGGAH